MPLKSSKAPIPTEAQEQRKVAEYLDRRKVLWLHPKNEGRAGVISGRLNKLGGVKKGAPDILIFSHPRGRNVLAVPFKGAAIELKRKKGSAFTAEQRAWLDALEAEGWDVALCYGADEAIKTLQLWGY